MDIKNYRDLRVWQSGMELVVMVYEISDKFPSKEMYGLTSQIRRAAVSVPSNIAEGHTRESTKEYLHHRWLSSPERSLRDVSKPPVSKESFVTRILYVTYWFRYGGGRASPPTQPTKCLSSLGRQLYSLRSALQSRNSK